jgi:hypothetical protein
MKDREEILMQAIRLHKINVDRFKRLVAVHERELNEAEAALKRLNEEKMADKLSTVRQKRLTRRHEDTKKKKERRSHLATDNTDKKKKDIATENTNKKKKADRDVGAPSERIHEYQRED